MRTKTENKSKYIHIRIDEDLKNKLNNFCDSKCMTPSRLIRELIKKHLLNE